MRPLIALAALMGLVLSCASWLDGPRPPALDRVDCYRGVLEPLLGAELTEAVLLDVLTGKTNPAVLLTNLGTDPADVLAAFAAWQACAPPPAPATLGT